MRRLAIHLECNEVKKSQKQYSDVETERGTERERESKRESLLYVVCGLLD
jgi:hypothetical protein